MKIKLTLLLTFAIAGILLFSVTKADACTEILVKAKDASVVNVRSMEFEVDLKSALNVQPRGAEFTSIVNGKAIGLKWTNKYGFVYMNAMGYPVALDGLNEAGLSFGALYLPGFTQYQTVPVGEESKGLWNLEVGLWILGNFSTVEEVRAAVSSVYVCQNATIGVSPLHYNITDASGKSIIIEYTSQGLQVFDNNAGVLTNSPPYDWHMANLRNYLNLSPNNPDSTSFDNEYFAPIGQGAGLVGLPGDWSPPSRFIKTAIMSHYALEPNNAPEAVNFALHFINGVDIPKGVSRINSKGKSEYDYTQWIVVRDLTNRKYMFRTYDNLQVRSIDLNKLDFSKGAKKSVIQINGGDGIIDITQNNH